LGRSRSVRSEVSEWERGSERGMDRTRGTRGVERVPPLWARRRSRRVARATRQTSGRVRIDRDFWRVDTLSLKVSEPCKRGCIKGRQRTNRESSAGGKLRKAFETRKGSSAETAPAAFAALKGTARISRSVASHLAISSGSASSSSGPASPRGPPCFEDDDDDERPIVAK
jgi:hypothetical protein